MTCYQISQDGQPVAIVASIAMARAIIMCRPRGTYEVDEVRIEDRPSRRKSWRSRPTCSSHPFGVRVGRLDWMGDGIARESASARVRP